MVSKFVSMALAFALVATVSFAAGESDSAGVLEPPNADAMIGSHPVGYAVLLILLTIMSIVGQGLVQTIVVLGVTGGIGGSRVVRSAVIAASAASRRKRHRRLSDCDSLLLPLEFGDVIEQPRRAHGNRMVTQSVVAERIHGRLRALVGVVLDEQRHLSFHRLGQHLLRSAHFPTLVAQYHPAVHVYALSRHVTRVFRSKERRHLGNLFWSLLAA